MIPIAWELEQAALAGRDRLAERAQRVAIAQTKPGTGGSVEKAMLDHARAEEFEEALLAASKSHFTEITTVTK
jgi:hypothetical protein